MNWLVVYGAFLCASFIRIFFRIVSDATSWNISGYGNEVGEGVALEIIFLILPSLGFLLGIYLAFLLVRIYVEPREVFVTAFLAHGAVLIFLGYIDTWQAIFIYGGIIFGGVLFKKLFRRNLIS
ncbi:MAG: hypothetical protein AAB518_02570 [Patescibacteria group bacterium]